MYCVTVNGFQGKLEVTMVWMTPSVTFLILFLVVITLSVFKMWSSVTLESSLTSSSLAYWREIRLLQENRWWNWGTGNQVTWPHSPNKLLIIVIDYSVRSTSHYSLPLSIIPQLPVIQLLKWNLLLSEFRHSPSVSMNRTKLFLWAQSPEVLICTQFCLYLAAFSGFRNDRAVLAEEFSHLWVCLGLKRYFSLNYPTYPTGISFFPRTVSSKTFLVIR